MTLTCNAVFFKHCLTPAIIYCCTIHYPPSNPGTGLLPEDTRVIYLIFAD